MQGDDISLCIFLTDSQTLSGTCTSLETPTSIDRIAAQEVYTAWMHIKLNPDFISCHYISGSQNELANQLAKLGRRQGWSYTGFTLPMFNPALSG